MNRFWRTVRHLSAGQVVSRVGLRSRALADRLAPRRATARGVRRAGPVPEVIRVPRAPVGLLRPTSKASIRDTARAVVEGRYSFLGETHELGASAWPAPADVSLLWAYHLEYMDFLLDLCLSGEEEHAGRLIRARWVTEGIARRSATHPYPASRRAASWIRVLDLIPERDRPMAATGAWVWAHHVADRLERDVGGNHLLENGLTLALAGTAFRGRRAARLRRIGREILVAGVRDQVLPDGAHYEMSPMYHARVLGVLLEGGLALESGGHPMPTRYWDSLAGMTAFLAAIVDPRGELPLLGDSARESCFRPDRFLRAVRAALPVPVTDFPAGDRAFPHCGLYRFEDPGAGTRLLLDAGAVCPERLPAHGQADTFTFEFHVEGVAFVVDAGLFEYVTGAMRDWCRSTCAHSTVTVDGENSAEVWSSFRVGRRAYVRDARWSVHSGRGSFRGSHDGYSHRGVAHHRAVHHLDRGLWLVMDRLSGRGHHAFTSRIHLHPDVVATGGPGGAWNLEREGRKLNLFPFGAERVSFDDGWYCPAFGSRCESRLLRLDASGSGAAFGYLLAAGDGPVPELTCDGAIVTVRRGEKSFPRELP